MKLSQKKVLNGKFLNTRAVGKPKTRWEDVIQRAALQVPGIRGWRKRAGDREEWGRLLRDGWMVKSKEKTWWGMLHACRKNRKTTIISWENLEERN